MEKLGFNKDTVASLKRSLLSNANLGLRIQIQGNYAFVYAPIFLEDISTPATYLFNWGKAEDNGTISQYLQAKAEQNGSIFHTFTYSLKPKRWYYVGVQEWTQTTFDWEIWSTLGQQDRPRSKILQHLEDHSGNNVLKREEIVELLNSRVLKQICFNLSGDAHVDSSREMCVAMGYTPPAS
ncbi:hypothetical protein BT96DRAFT_469401 [Gymnopus androsaceus JB14]|uniref:Uncharacterized protein n=1 Tax=Gymnopus androsaceus JB14 TaxID=1447944 RepID=A0A6A4IPA4_9AGAR|nr:hypothetical protein BT96DRAFT_469401 [Gymnopus androsaceus JB14]